MCASVLCWVLYRNMSRHMTSYSVHAWVLVSCDVWGMCVCVCVCMCVCVSERERVCVCVCVCVKTHDILLCACQGACQLWCVGHVCVCVCVHVCVCVCVCMCMCVCVCVCVCVWERERDRQTDRQTDRTFVCFLFVCLFVWLPYCQMEISTQTNKEVLSLS